MKTCKICGKRMKWFQVRETIWQNKNKYKVCNTCFYEYINQEEKEFFRKEKLRHQEQNAITEKKVYDFRNKLKEK